MTVCHATVKEDPQMLLPATASSPWPPLFAKCVVGEYDKPLREANRTVETTACHNNPVW